MSEQDKRIDQAFEHWKKGEALEAGKIIFESLSTEIQPRWAAHILESVVKRTGIKSPPIEHILRLANNPNEWGKAHDAFSLARKSTVALEKLSARSSEQSLLLSELLLAELAAKVAYNSTYPINEFDEDSGWWVAVCLKDILERLDDEEFSKSMWLVLCNDMPQTSGASDGTG